MSFRGGPSLIPKNLVNANEWSQRIGCDIKKSYARHMQIQVSSFLERHSSSSSSKQWRTRQERDSFVTNAKVQGLKSRAAFKLLEV